MSGKLILLLTLLTWTAVGAAAADSTGELPRPWLQLHTSAQVLQLVCKPPPEASEWDELHDLRLFVSLFHIRRSAWNRKSIANMTTAMTEPSVDKDLPKITHVSFEGDWERKTPSLTVLMPMTSQDYGEYYCTGEYSKSTSPGRTSNFTTPFTVDEVLASGHSQQYKESEVNNFQVRVIDTHEVNVTWLPTNSKFMEASISRTTVDNDGREISPAYSLFATSRSDHLIYKDSGVILASFSYPAQNRHANYSMTVYVERDACDPTCRYTCRVPDPRCTGEDAKLCNCQGTDEGTAASAGGVNGWMIAFIVFFIAALAFNVVILVLGCKKGWFKGISCTNKSNGTVPHALNEDPERKTEETPPRRASTTAEDFVPQQTGNKGTHTEIRPANSTGIPITSNKQQPRGEQHTPKFQAGRTYDEKGKGVCATPSLGKASYIVALPELYCYNPEDEASEDELHQLDSDETFDVESEVLGAVGGNLKLPRSNLPLSSGKRKQAPCETDDFHSIGRRPPAGYQDLRLTPPRYQLPDEVRRSSSTLTPTERDDELQGPIPKLEEFEEMLPKDRDDSFDSRSFSSLSTSVLNSIPGEHTSSASRTGRRNKKPTSKR
ncbi:uncharacterized protein [Littorina saxatilis]|uniref:uncharacterized protein n=1 Tax=Littorina saxatilis TaxID=31220 RepID=UPI0038B653B8